MDTSPQLTNVLRLKTKLFEFKEKGKVTAEAYAALNHQLDRELKEAIADWPDVELETLIKWAQNNLPQLDISVYLQTLLQQRSADIIKHHQQAIAAKKTNLDVSRWFPDADAITFNRFDWKQCVDDLDALIQNLKNPHTPFVENVVACTRFFNRGHLPAGLPVPTTQLIGEMINKKLITTYDAPALIDDTLSVLEGLKQAQRRAIKPSNVSQAAYTQLLNELSTPESAGSLDVEKRLMSWQGPYHPILLEDWLENRTARRQELITALVGIDPLREAAKWQAWLIENKRDTLAAELRIDELVRSEPIVYGIANLLACAELIPGGLPQLEAKWHPVLLSLTQNRAEPAPTPTQPKATPAQAAPSKRAAEKPNQEKTDEDLFTLDEVTFIDEEGADFEYVEDEVDHFYAPKQTHSEQDKIVEQESNWNLYLKPFLSENWLGLIGVSSLMVAWLFLSMWIWDKGPYYRMAAGAIPMLAITLGAGWITQFFHKLESRGTSRKAVELFTALTLLSIPFNFLIDASLLESGGIIGLSLAALALTIHFAVITRLIGRWLQVPLGMNPRRYLIVANTLLLLPTLAILFAPERLAISVSITLLLAYGALVRCLSRLDRPSSRFPYIALSIQFAIAIATLHIYHSVPLDLMTASVLIELVAITLIVFFPTRASVIVAAGALTIFGQAIGFIEPKILPVTLALAMVCWLRISRHQSAAWVHDILVLHLFALNASLAYLFDIAHEWWPLLLLPSLLITIGFERKRNIANITPLSNGIPFYMFALAIIAPADEWLRLGIAILITLIGVYAYLRYSKANLLGHWLANLALIAFAPVVLFYHTFFTELELLANYTALLAIAWALLSPHFKDLFAHQHRTTVLWVFSYLAAASVIYTIYTIGYQPSILVPAFITLATLVIAAVRSASSLPIYIFLTLAAYLGMSVKGYYQISSSSGLGAVLIASALVILAHLLPRLRWFKTPERVDRLFSSPFILHTPNFIYTPLTQAALLFVLLSMTKAAFAYAPTIDSWPLSLAMLIQTTLLFLGAKQKRSVMLSLLMLLPATGLASALVLSLPYVYMPLATVLGLLAFSIMLERLTLSDPDCESEPVLDIMKEYQKRLVWLSVPAGLAAYALMVSASPIIIATYCIAIIALNHRYLSRHYAHFVHLTFIHLWIIWALAYLYFLGDVPTNFIQLFDVLPWFIYGVAMMVAFVLISSRRPHVMAAYRYDAKRWSWP
ncbi:hypothetical protein ACFL2V_14310, partial [Pseudomonadota bacterium]